jgi:hypothetical protein
MVKTIEEVKQEILDAMSIVLGEKPITGTGVVKDLAEAFHVLTTAALTAQDAGLVENIGRKLAEHEMMLKAIVGKLGLK